MQLTALHSFEELDLAKGERIIYRVNPHPMAFLRNSVPGVFLLAVGAVIFWLMNRFMGFLSVESTVFIVLVSGIPFLLGVYSLLQRYFDWIFDQGVITDKRVLVFDIGFPFSREINSVEYDSIRDVNVHQKGFSRIIFHYGTVEIQTSNSVNIDGVSNTKLLLVDIPHPRRMQKLIDLLQGDPEARKRDKDELLLECGLEEFLDIWKGFGDRVKKVVGRG